MANGALIAVLDFTGLKADEFHDWYDTEHIPERLAVPGFLTAQRWIGAEAPRLSVALYDLSDIEVLRSPAYQAIAGAHFSPWSRRILPACRSFHRYEAVQLVPGDAVSPDGAGALLLVQLSVEPAAEPESAERYEVSHLARLAAVAGVLSARLFRVTAGGTGYAGLFHLESPAVLETQAWTSAEAGSGSRRAGPGVREELRVVAVPYRRR